MGDSEKSEHVEEELADVFFFILRFAQMNNIDLHDALTDKLEKNAKKYPIDMIKGKNLKYTEIQTDEAQDIDPDMQIIVEI